MTMFPIQLIKEAYEEGSWAKVAEAYKSLTGDELPSKVPEYAIVKQAESPKKKRGRPRKNPQNAEDLPVTVQLERTSVLEVGRTDLKQFEVQPSDQSRVRPDGGTYCKVEPFKPGMVNNFKADKAEAARESEIDKKLMGHITPTPRRAPVEHLTTKKTKCRNCEQTFDVDPFDLVSVDGDDRQYICAKCVKSLR